MGKMKFLISSIVIFSVLYSCSNEDDVNNTEELPNYFEIAGTYRLTNVTSNYPVDYNADGDYETNIFPFIGSSCRSTIELMEDGRMVWNYLDYFGGIGIIYNSDCEMAPNSQVPNSCRLNNGNGEGLQPYRYAILSYENNQLNFVDEFNDPYSWQLSNDKIVITQVEPLMLAYLYEGMEYPSGFSCSPGEGIYLTYTFQKQ